MNKSLVKFIIVEDFKGVLINSINNRLSIAIYFFFIKSLDFSSSKILYFINLMLTISTFAQHQKINYSNAPYLV